MTKATKKLVYAILAYEVIVCGLCFALGVVYGRHH